MTYACPLCGHGLASVSTRQDYFCAGCQAAVCLDGRTAYVYQQGAAGSLQVITAQLMSKASPLPGGGEAGERLRQS